MTKLSLLKVDFTLKKHELLILFKYPNRNISFRLKVFRFKDNETRQFLIYCPSLGITGYGLNINKADIMIKSSIKKYCVEFLKFSKKRQKMELTNLFN